MPGSIGAEGYPYPLPSEGPDGPGGIQALAQRISDVTTPVATQAALPATGNWLGRRKNVTAIPGAIFEWNGAAWKMFGIPVFADAAARTSAITAPADNMLSIRADVDYVEQYLSGSWGRLNQLIVAPLVPTVVGTGGASAVDPITGLVTFSGTLTNLDCYIPTAQIAQITAAKFLRVNIGYTGATASTELRQLLTGAGAVDATTNYFVDYDYNSAATAAAASPVAASSWSMVAGAGRKRRRHILDVFNLAAALPTECVGPFNDSDMTTNRINGALAHTHEGNTVLAGFRLAITGAGAISNGAFSMEAHY